MATRAANPSASNRTQADAVGKLEPTGPYWWHPSPSGSERPSDRTTFDVESQFRGALTLHGMHDALAFLNSRTRYRFTGVYRVDPPALRNECLFDRENPGVELGGDVSVLDGTYCGLVAATQAPFAVADAPVDTRLARHPARHSVLSYVGVPALANNGHVIGTLCHFDLRPRILTLDELAVLESVSFIVSSWLIGKQPVA